jgi:phosphoribosylformylglycinamidine synthase
VVTFPGSNDDRDTRSALSRLFDDEIVALWHKDRGLGGSDCVVLPGGFSYGDYLRAGAIARFSPIMDAVGAHARAGGAVLGICNGFQVLCEAGLLPGALVMNRALRFVCRDVSVRVESVASAGTASCKAGDRLTIPIKHGEGCYVTGDEALAKLEAGGQVIFRYVDADGERRAEANPNGSANDVAGVRNERGNVAGMMPHPEHAVDPLLGTTDGRHVFESIRAWVGRSGA